MTPNRDRDAPRAGGADLFAGPVVPEATPNPRTIRFVTPPIHSGPSRWYASADDADDPRVARLFAEFDDVANVLVGPAFVAVGLHRPDRWEEVLDPILRAITTEFATAEFATGEFATDGLNVGESDPAATATVDAPTPRAEPADEHTTALERAWKELGALRPEAASDRERILASASSSDAAVEVASRLLADADPAVAQQSWARLLDDSSRRVRRATVDAMVDVGRPSLRPLLEQALHDTDAWTRWKALRGLVELGVEPSRAAVSALGDDPDFRVRLEVTRALPGFEPSGPPR